jgi:hypothetical protein
VSFWHRTGPTDGNSSADAGESPYRMVGRQLKETESWPRVRPSTRGLAPLDLSSGRRQDDPGLMALTPAEVGI